MELSKPGLAAFAILLVVAIGYALFFKETDRQKFDRLTVGMDANEVRDILDPPRSGKYAGFRMEIRDEENLRYNDCMLLVIHNGILVEKEWIGPDESAPDKNGRSGSGGS